MPLQIILFEPEIPPNTGNIIRLCANAGAHLHLVEPMQFNLSDKQCRRAGLDYHALANVRTHPNLETAIGAATDMPNTRIFACSSKVTTKYSEPNYNSNDAFLFGPETRGLGAEILSKFPENQKITIPMQPGSRSLNLSNSVAIILYEAWRQLGFS